MIGSKEIYFLIEKEDIIDKVNNVGAMYQGGYLDKKNFKTLTIEGRLYLIVNIENVDTDEKLFDLGYKLAYQLNKDFDLIQLRELNNTL